MTETMSWLQTVVLGALQGLTEFLPISSSGHLRIVSQIWFGQDAGAAFTAVTQLGTELAVLIFFAKDIWRIVLAWFGGLRNPERRGVDYRIGWYVILATIPIGVLGFVFRHQISTAARNLWVVAIMLILFSFVFIAAERVGSRSKSIETMTRRDAIAMGLAQCLALIPGVSRSGATASAGLFVGMERAAAFRFSFLIAIPAVVASGLFSLKDAFEPAAEGQVTASGPQIVVATGIAFVLGYVSIAWLLKFVSHHSLAWFAGYRIALGLVVIGLLAGGVVSAT
ncbi:undecaprenyl-diphosphate phosphatase [Gordonia sp. PDNC005]|uniref:undecaprenyl-diphosphate phosphatase n=1 Tax=unclassified Gordonia (in: high G+C Gram-positive bacteria) TaxID=2657482 RepID=UPI001964C71D|nr:undecaprenyl-diphosphate phosphatase [Gordonia sp. PDNC005]QRY64125.1 undecaprenyl-diphosphate phosphatase [Gordonia sp. PDNC005]